MIFGRPVKSILALVLCLLVSISFCYAANEVKAPKKIVAVADFENKTNVSGQWDLGKGMADMLTDALMQSGQFIVLERQTLDAVMAEQNLAASGRAASVGGAQMGDIKRAQVLVQGAITEYLATSNGGGQSMSVGGFNLGQSSGEAHVAVIIRLIDTTTSQVIASQRVEGKASRGGTDLGMSRSGWGFTQSGRKATPIDKAVQIAIDNAVNYIATQMGTVPWRGKIIKVSETGEAYINAGSEANINTGSIFMVFRPGEELIDPDTGMDLGSEEEFIGRLKVTEVKPKFCKGQSLDGQPQEGDVVKFAQ